MSIDLKSFLAEAGQNPSMVNQLRRNPQGLGGEFGLNSGEVDAVLSGDQRQVENALGFNLWDMPVFFRPPKTE